MCYQYNKVFSHERLTTILEQETGMEKVLESDFNSLRFCGMRVTALRDTSDHRTFLVGIKEKRKNVINLNKINSKMTAMGRQSEVEFKGWGVTMLILKTEKSTYTLCGWQSKK